jgi:hypothetical protein
MPAILPNRHDGEKSQTDRDARLRTVSERDLKREGQENVAT